MFTIKETSQQLGISPQAIYLKKAKLKVLGYITEDNQVTVERNKLFA